MLKRRSNANFNIKLLTNQLNTFKRLFLFIFTDKSNRSLRFLFENINFLLSSNNHLLKFITCKNVIYGHSICDQELSFWSYRVKFSKVTGTQTRKGCEDFLFDFSHRKKYSKYWAPECVRIPALQAQNLPKSSRKCLCIWPPM